MKHSTPWADEQMNGEMDRDINNYSEDMVGLGYDTGLTFREL
jgi:hypothetical protein